jgi:trigger factor
MSDEQEVKTPKNKVKVKDAGPCRKKITIEVPAESIKLAYDEQYGDLGKGAEVPGFRKGRAPRRLLEKRFGKDVTLQVKLKLISGACDTAIKDNKLDVLREPDIDPEKIDLPDDGNLKFDFEIEVRPEFDLPALEAIPVEKTTLTVSDDQVDAEVAQLRKYSGLWAPREQADAAEAEDQLIADVLIKVEGVEEEIKLDNTTIHIRKNGFVGEIPVEDLEKLLVGAKVGDEKQTTVDVPKTFFREEYRGKKVEIKISVKDIKWLKPAELDKNFLERFGVEDEDDLKEKMQDSLGSRLERQVREQMAEQIYKHLLDKTKFDLPTDIIAQQAGSILQRQYMNLLQRGLSREQLEEQAEQLKATSQEQAEQQLRTFFIMDKVADKLKIQTSDEEVNGQIAQMAIMQNQRPEKMREDMVRNGTLEQFKMQVRDDKSIAKLLESAKITEVKPKKAKKTKKKVKKVAKKTEKKTKKAPAAKKKAVKKTKKATKKKTGK